MHIIFGPYLGHIYIYIYIYIYICILSKDLSLYRASCLDGDYDTSPSWGSALEPAGGAGRTAWPQVALAWTNDDSHDMCIYIYSIYIYI